MIIEHVVWGTLRASVLLGLALGVTLLLRKSSAATRRLLLVLALGGALVAPAAALVVPAWHVPAPAGTPWLQGKVVAERGVEGPAPMTKSAASTPLPPAPVASRARLDPFALLAIAWALGALFVAARLAMGLARASAMARRAAPAAGWSSSMARASSALGVRADVRESDEVESPMMTGVVRPVVLVPHASSGWDERRRQAVLLHELAHVRQRDCLAQIVAQLACAVHWFNPLVWLAASRLRVERELAADDAVLAAGESASSYAEDLLAIAGVARTALVPEGALGMGEGRRLVARVEAVLSTEFARAPLGRFRASLLVVGAAAVVTLVACTHPIESTPAASSASAPAAAVAAVASGHTTIDPRIQAIADEELEHALAEWQATAGTILVLDPSTGEIRASAGRSHGVASDVAIRDAYFPGSTFKLVTMAGALDDGAVRATDTFDCENGVWKIDGKDFHDAHENGLLTLPEVMAVSSNIGIAKVSMRLGGARLQHWVHAFHFGEAPPVPGASAGMPVPQPRDNSMGGALLAIGESFAASPLQIAAAYAVIANGGLYVPPTLTTREGQASPEAVVKPETARLVTAMLEEVVSSEHGTGALARVDGMRVAGKTGTAAWDRPGGGEGTYASFVGFVPSDKPRYVILAGVEQPKPKGDSDWAAGGNVAAPVFAKVATRALAVR